MFIVEARHYTSLKFLLKGLKYESESFSKTIAIELKSKALSKAEMKKYVKENVFSQCSSIAEEIFYRGVIKSETVFIGDNHERRTLISWEREVETTK